MKADIVVDLGYGDSGKGITVDNLCLDAENRSEKAIVVRFSGGHQCGHDVHVSGESSHVHCSYGSGALRGVPSYFTEDTTMYLPRIITEHQVLREKGAPCCLTLHALAKVTTPYDIMWNQLTERNNKHGSVGVGVGATMHRNLTTGYKLNVIDFTDLQMFEWKMKAIRSYYMARAEKELDMRGYEFVSACRDEAKVFAQDLPDWHKYFHISGSYADLRFYDRAIFEGSQGIMLDMDHGVFPHVTYANTTSKNAVKICELLGVRPELYYVTRCYFTRHGNGPLPEGEDLKLKNNWMEKNIPHEWQGEFKTREIQPQLLNLALGYDGLYAGPVDKNLVVTCLDQLEEFDIDKLTAALKCKFKKVYATNSHITRGLWIMDEVHAELV